MFSNLVTVSKETPTHFSVVDDCSPKFSRRGLLASFVGVSALPVVGAFAPVEAANDNLLLENGAVFATEDGNVLLLNLNPNASPPTILAPAIDPQPLLDAQRSRLGIDQLIIASLPNPAGYVEDDPAVVEEPGVDNTPSTGDSGTIGTTVSSTGNKVVDRAVFGDFTQIADIGNTGPVGAQIPGLEISQYRRNAIARSLGYTGQFGDGSFWNYRMSNPAFNNLFLSFVDVFKTARTAGLIGL